ncbi:MAG: DUF5723 family protein [Flavobacteriaceae bacterium]|nr:DUF5723 family protein [Flavobacteriaceae bacterium]
MKNILVGFSFLISFSVLAQNKQILFNFDQLPQTLLLNPGEVVSQKWHTGIPLLSGFSAHIGSSDITVYDIYGDDNGSINDKVKALVYDLRSSDFASINQQEELFNVGIKLRNHRDFLSFGYYQEFDAIAYYPKDLAILFYEGNSNIGERYSLNQVNFKAELLGVLHAGVSRKIDDDLQIGARVKIYSGVFNMQTRQNKGTFSTELGLLNQYTHVLAGVDASFETSGIFLPSGTEVDPAYIRNKLLIGGNLGLGFDLGFTYFPQKQWTVSGSILDVGFINNKQNNRVYKAQGSFRFEGIEPNFDPNATIDYWEDLKDEFEDDLNYTESSDSYLSWRSTKVNAQIKYEFGEDRLVDCFDTEVDPGYINAVGAHLFTVFRPVAPQIAATVFYERKFTKELRAKLTYTVDSFSFTNLGLGLSAKIGVFNIYGIADNLLGYQNLAKTNSASFQLGLNIIVP